MTTELTIEPTGSSDTDACACCGRASRWVWGYAHDQSDPVAAYFVHWTPGGVAEHGANIDLIVGDWGASGDAERRLAVALTYRLPPTGPTLLVIDAAGRPFTQDESFVGRVTNRDDVIGTEVAEVAFAIAGAVLVQDRRVAELLGEWAPDRP